jgi:hypothetical protein
MLVLRRRSPRGYVIPTAYKRYTIHVRLLQFCVWLTPLQAAPDIADCCPAAPAARSQFCWPHPGIPRADLSDAALEVPPPDPQQPVDDFCLLVMHVEEVRAGGKHMCNCLAARAAWLSATPTSAVHWG